MQFAIPTTKDGMFSTLAEIYAFYRLSRFEYVGTELDELKIEKLEMDIPNETELKERARLNTFSSQAKEKRNRGERCNLTGSRSEVWVQIPVTRSK